MAFQTFYIAIYVLHLRFFIKYTHTNYFIDDVMGGCDNISIVIYFMLFQTYFPVHQRLTDTLCY